MRYTFRIIALFFLFQNFSLIGQDYKIHGFIRDDSTESRGMFVNIIIYKDSKLVKDLTSDRNGKFSVEQLEKGSYIIKIWDVEHDTNTFVGIYATTANEEIIFNLKRRKTLKDGIYE